MNLVEFAETPPKTRLARSPFLTKRIFGMDLGLLYEFDVPQPWQGEYP